MVEGLDADNALVTKGKLVGEHSSLKVTLTKEQTIRNEQESKFRARQIVYALNEKLLREMPKYLGINEGLFWKKYKFSNINQVNKEAAKNEAVKGAWEKVCVEFDMDPNISSDYNFIMKDLNYFIHDSSFAHTQDISTLEEEAKEVFGTKTVKQRASLEIYLQLFHLAVEVSKKCKKDLYEYE